MWWIPAALAGQVFDEVVPLADVLPGADALAVVTIDGPPVDALVPVAGEGCPPRGSAVQRVVVKRVLGQGELGPALAPGDALDVHGGSLPVMLDVASAWCTEQLSISPILPRIEGERPEPGRELVALLRWHPPIGWVELLDGAWAPAARADDLAAAWATGTHRAAPDPAGFEEVACRADADCVAAVPACGAEPTWRVAHRAAVASLARACGGKQAPPPTAPPPTARCDAGRCVAR